MVSGEEQRFDDYNDFIGITKISENLKLLSRMHNQFATHLHNIVVYVNCITL